jgi:hypothetical protein
MKWQVLSPELAALRQHWRWWTALVEVFAGRHRGARVVDPEEYQALHRQLLAACRTLAGGAEGPERQLYQRLEELVRPWLTVYALRQADREILLDLLVRCRQAEQELPSQFRPRRVPRWAAAALIGIVAVAVLLVFTAGAWFLDQEWVRGRWHALVRTVQAAEGLQWWYVPVAIAVVAAMVLVWRSGRNLTG